MTRFRRRTLIGAGLLVLVLLGLGGWFYFVAFANLEATLQRAEAFALRRMKVTQLAEHGVYRFFFVTNRRSEASGGPQPQYLPIKFQVSSLLW